MAQVEFDIPNLSIVGKNVVESELNNNFFVQKNNGEKLEHNPLMPRADKV